MLLFKLELNSLCELNTFYSVHRHGSRPNQPGYFDLRYERQLFLAIVEGSYLADTMQHDISGRGGLPSVFHRSLWADKVLQLRSHNRAAIVESRLQYMHQDGEELLRNPVHGVS